MEQDPRDPGFPAVQVPPGLVAGQVALVTGASTGIGRAIALALAQSGADVAIGCRENCDDANALVAAIRALGRKAEVVAGDVASEEQVVAMFQKVAADLGTVDIVVANAGMERDAMVADMTLEDWERVIEVNLTGAFLCAREGLREFRRRGPRPVSAALGKIIFTSSVHDIIPWTGHANYVASKGGLLMFMKSLAQEVAGERIRVNAISPGAIRTPINRHAWETEEALRDLLTKIPYGRIGEPADVARAAVWLASDQADYITGTTLYVDGGMTLYPSFASGG